MRRLAHGAFDEPDDLRSRAEAIRIGARLTLVAAIAGIAYAVATWAEPHRAAIVALFLASMATGHLPLAAGADRVARNPLREPLLLGWVVCSFAYVAPIVALDGGVASPYTVLFVLPVVFVGFSFPQGSVVAVGALDVLALVGVGIASGSTQATLAFFAACLAIIALLCALLALDQERRREALARISRADPLTGCLNRRGLEERLDAELAGCRRSGESAGLVVIDLDHFKEVNDTHGHAAGDALLRWVVDRAESVLRPVDSVGRLGGDEFAVVVPGADSGEAMDVADRLRSALAERVPVSTGTASFPAEAADRDALHRRADRELYANKRARAVKNGAGSRELAWAGG